MAKIFYADKKPVDQHSKKKFTPDSNRNRAGDSWGNKLGPFIKIISFIHKFRIYRFFKWFHPKILNLFGLLFGILALGRSEAMRYKIEKSFNALFPNKISEKRMKKLYLASIKYFGSIFLDIMIHLPLTLERSTKKYFTYKNPEKLDEEILKGNGVIILMVHTGDYLHAVSSLLQFPNVPKISAVASIPNMILFENINRPSLDHFYIYASTTFSKISRYLEDHLKQNHLLIIMLDFTNRNQLRVPFSNNFPYLVNSPQAFISLHKKTNASILPVICHPNGSIGKSEIEFLNNNDIMETSKKYWNHSKKTFHGMISTAINNSISPMVRKYAHVWEEIGDFGIIRIADKIEFEKGCTIYNFITKIQDKMISIIEGSFEPNRNDEEILRVIVKQLEEISNVIIKPDAILRTHKSKIDLSQMNGTSELIKISATASKELKNKEEFDSALLFDELCEKLRDIKPL